MSSGPLTMSTSTKKSADIIQLPTSQMGARVETVKVVRAAVEKKLSYLMEGLAYNVAEALFEEMRGMDEQDALACHFNVMRSLKTQSAELRGNFTALMNKSWMNTIHRKDKQGVSDAPLDVTPTLKAYSDKNLNHYKVLLEEIRQRFCSLSRREVAFHPLLPGNFYLCFWHATESLDLTYQERKLLLPLFNRFVMDRFGQVLSIANQVLIDRGVAMWDQRGER
ncbi:MAG: DUF1631 family protein [Pseudomonadales bacterium]|nr:DUF1631 family protein [Pseudomonadales bacterium]